MKPLVGVVMGSRSDWETMAHAAETLDSFAVPFEVRVLSAHRTPDALLEWASTAEARGLAVIIAAAGGAAHLAGVTAAKTTLPVLGVPMESAALKGMDSLLSTVQMPAGIPVATFASAAPAPPMPRSSRWPSSPGRTSGCATPSGASGKSRATKCSRWATRGSPPGASARAYRTVHSISR